MRLSIGACFRPFYQFGGVSCAGGTPANLTISTSAEHPIHRKPSPTFAKSRDPSLSRPRTASDALLRRQSLMLPQIAQYQCYQPRNIDRGFEVQLRTRLSAPPTLRSTEHVRSQQPTQLVHDQRLDCRARYLTSPRVSAINQ